MCYLYTLTFLIGTENRLVPPDFKGSLVWSSAQEIPSKMEKMIIFVLFDSFGSIFKLDEENEFSSPFLLFLFIL